MRVIYVILLIIISCKVCAQPSAQLIKELNLNVPYYPCTISLEAASFKQEYRLSNSIAGFTIKGLDSGNYKLLFTSGSEKKILRDSIVITTGQYLVVNLTSDSCLYDYPLGYIPECPNNHKDKIVPIRYGLLATVIPKNGINSQIKSEQNYYPGGCVITRCDPKYYCTIHKIEF